LIKGKGREDLAGNAGENNGETTIYGRHIVRSVLYNPANNKPDDYQYKIKERTLSPTYDHNSCNLQNDNYQFNGNLNNGCYLNSVNQLYDVYFQGKNAEYNDVNASDYLQDYNLAPTVINGSKNNQWNQTQDYYRQLIVNRGLGKTSNISSLTDSTQSSQSNVSTKLDSPNTSSLLGLQAINSASNLDSTTNRPQLNTSWRRSGDVFHFYSIGTNGINGAITRTGVRTKCYLMRIIDANLS
jgi:hypothetical protein